MGLWIIIMTLVAITHQEGILVRIISIYLVFLWAINTLNIRQSCFKPSQLSITILPGPEVVYIEHIPVDETFQTVTLTNANKRPQHYHVGVSGNWYRLCAKLRPPKAFINYLVGIIYEAWIIHVIAYYVKNNNSNNLCNINVAQM